MKLVVIGHRLVQPIGGGTGWRVLLRVEQQRGRNVGEAQRAGELAGRQWSGLPAVQVEDTQPGRADLQRERESGPDAGASGPLPVRALRQAGLGVAPEGAQSRLGLYW